MPLEITTRSGSTATFTGEQVDELRMGFRGPLITPQDDGYEQARTVENRYIDRRPGLIVRCSGTADVIDAVNLARDHDLLVAVRGGGHHVAGHSMADGGLVIDLSTMTAVRVDPDNRRVEVQGGATWGDVDRETQAFGLAVPGGVVSTTGVGGLTLGGGIGWLHRRWGLACDSLRAAELVTANGQLVRASAEDNPDLLWGLRGGGGNFGVVVNFTFDAYPLGPMVMVGATCYPAAEGATLMRAWRDWAVEVPDEVTTRAIFVTLPADPHLPPEVHDQEVLMAAALYAGDPDKGAEVVQPVRELGEPLADISGPYPYRMFQSGFDELLAGLRGYWKSTFLAELTDEVIDLIAERAMDRPHPLTAVHVPLLGGATGRVGASDTAFGDRSAPWMLSVDGAWDDPALDERAIAWVRQAIADAQRLPGVGGAYLNFSADAGDDTSVVEAQYGHNLERLAELKKAYDPDNLFRLNSNIRPA